MYGIYLCLSRFSSDTNDVNQSKLRAILTKTGYTVVELRDDTDESSNWCVTTERCGRTYQVISDHRRNLLAFKIPLAPDVVQVLDQHDLQSLREDEALSVIENWLIKAVKDLFAAELHEGEMLRVKRDFVAYGFEVVKVYCIYPIQMHVGDMVQITGHQDVWGWGFKILTGDVKDFARDRITSKDQWLAELIIQTAGGLYGGLHEQGQCNVDGLQPYDVFEPVEPNSKFGTGTQACRSI